MAHTLQSVRLCRKLARSAPWSSCRGDGLTVIRWKKKSDEKTTLDTFVVSQQTDFDSVNQALYIGKKKSLPPKKNQSAREIQNWPTDYSIGSNVMHRWRTNKKTNLGLVPLRKDFLLRVVMI